MARDTLLSRMLLLEADSLSMAADLVDSDVFDAAFGVLYSARHVHTTGVGKSGRIAQKAADLFCSVGKASSFLHPTEAMHGDLGRLHRHDPVLMLSASGASPELVGLAEQLKLDGHDIVLLTAAQECPLQHFAKVTIQFPTRDLGPVPFVPIVASVVMNGIVDAMVTQMAIDNRVDEEAFRRWHPARPVGA